MSTHLYMLPPSVNNLAVRVFLRASGLPFTEENAWGKTRSPEFLAKFPAHFTPAIESADHPRGAMWESCAIMMFLANKHHLDALYPTDPGKRALVDSANFYFTGTLYPRVARATYPRLGFGGYAIAYLLGQRLFPLFPRRVIVTGADLLQLAVIVLAISFASSVLGIWKALLVKPNEALS